LVNLNSKTIVNLMKISFILRLSIAGLFISGLVACGGGGGGSSTASTSATPTTLSGKVIDGYIIGATVCLDINSNNKCDAGEPTTTSGENGAWTLPPAEGVVIRAAWDQEYGYVVDVQHKNAIVTRYAHAQELLVKQGDFVKQSQVIAKVGSTGRSTGPHLHYEVIRDGVTLGKN
jgi:hypothetical protein